MDESNTHSDIFIATVVLGLLTIFLISSLFGESTEPKTDLSQYSEQIQEIKEYQETLPVETHGEFVSTWMTVEATAYCTCEICCEEFSDGITATGRDASIAGVAVDPTIIPYYSRIDIPNINLGTNGNGSWLLADDCGGAIKGDRIDIRFTSHQAAREYGRRIVLIRVWRKQ